MPRDLKIPSKKRQIEFGREEVEASFRSLAEMAASAIFIYQGTKLLYVNPAAERLTCYSRQELFEMNFYDLFSSKRTLKNWDLQLKQGKDQSFRDELILKTRGGEEKWIDLTVGLIEYKEKYISIGTAFDITERKKAELLQDAVYRIAQAAYHSDRLDDLFPEIHAIIAQVMNAGNFYIALYDRAADLITYPYFVDEYDQQPDGGIPPGKGLTEYVLRTGKSLLCDPSTHDQLEEAGEVELIGTPSPIWLGVPLKVDNDVIGVMVVQHYADPLAYGERERGSWNLFLPRLRW